MLRADGLMLTIAEILALSWGVLLISDGVSHTIGISAYDKLLWDSGAAYPTDLSGAGAKQLLAQALQAEGNADARQFRVVQFLIWQPWRLVLPELAAQCRQMQRDHAGLGCS